MDKRSCFRSALVHLVYRGQYRVIQTEKPLISLSINRYQIKKRGAERSASLSTDEAIFRTGETSFLRFITGYGEGYRNSDIYMVKPGDELSRQDPLQRGLSLGIPYRCRTPRQNQLAEV